MPIACNHTLFWKCEERKDMKTDIQSSQGAHGKALCWMARILSLPVAIFGVIWMFYVPTTWEGGSDSVPLLLPLDLIPLVLALIAWKWHLVGGTLLSAFGILLGVMGISSFSEEGPNHDYLYLTPIGAVLLTGGLLHVLAWAKERSGKRTPGRT